MTDRYGFDEFDLAPKGPSADNIREEERKKELASKNKVDRTEEWLHALEVIRETTPEQVNTLEVQDAILYDKLELKNKIAEFKVYCDKHGIAYNKMSHSVGDDVTKPPPAVLEPMPEEQRDREKEKIFRDKVYINSDDFKKLGDNAVKMGFLSKDIADDMIRSADSLHKYMLPLVDDIWTQGQWENAYPQVAEKVESDNDFTETPWFIRYRYPVEDDGTVTNKHPYTHEHQVGGSIIPKLNIVMHVADNLPSFFKQLWENDSKTRHQQIMKREEKKSENRTGKKKRKKEYQVSRYTEDPDDYDMSTGLHGDPRRGLPTPSQFKDEEEFDAIPEAHWLGLVKKKKVGEKVDYTEYIQAKVAYWKAIGIDDKTIEKWLKPLRDLGIKF